MMDSSEIDLSKENIQPLKEGRLTSYLGTALNAQSDIKSQNEILREREKFELELRKYKGNDPLDIWYNYICWVIQSYPNSGAGHLSPLLHKCLATFKDDDRYIQDVRYIKLWIKYIQMQDDPLETYEMVHKHGIGNKCAEFYKCWAEVYERAMDFKGASAVFTKGKEYGAQPASDLALYQRNFEDRVARHLALNKGDSWENTNSEEEKRQVLSSLAVTSQGRGRQPATVGSIRVGAAIAGPPGALRQSNSARKEPKQTQFQIFSDHRGTENRDPVKLETLPSASVTNRENLIKPGKWTNPSSSKKASNNAETPRLTTPFKVHEDTSSAQGVATPGGAIFSENVLKQRKLVKDDFDCPHVIFDPPDPSKISMYCKDKVYSGGVEFSLEEIRAIRYFEAAKKEQEEKAEMEEAARSLEVDSGNDDAMDKTLSMKENQDVWSSNEDLLATPVVTVPKQLKLREPQREGERNDRARSNRGPSQHLDFSTFASPTINTRVANDMMHELWSTTFTRNLGDSLLVVPQQPPSHTPKFEIPFDETTSFPDMPYSEENAVRIQPNPSKFEIHFDQKLTFQESPVKEDDKEGGLLKEVPADWGKHIPFVPPPKEDEEEEQQEENSKENFCPSDYEQPQNREKRELVGVLQPSKDIPFKPLEEEATEDQESECDYQGGDLMNRATPSHKPFTIAADGITYEREIKTVKVESSEPCSTRKRKFTIFEDKVTDMLSKNGNGDLVYKHMHTQVKFEPKATPNMRSICEISNEPQTYINIPSSSSVSRQIGEVSGMPRSLEPTASEKCEVVEDPNDFMIQETLLGKMPNPITRSTNFYRILQKIPFLRTNQEINLRKGLKLKILKVLNSSPECKFYLAVQEDGEHVFVKCRKTSCEWEFYIFREIRSRLRDSYMIGAYANIKEGYLFNSDASMLLLEYIPNGSLLDLLNLFKIKKRVFPEVLTLYFAIDIINMVKHLHNCHIIHTAIKPENLLILKTPESPVRWSKEYFCNHIPALQLIHFEECIDMTLFPENVQFITRSANKNFHCIEMQTGKPWTYHDDFYGIAFTIHCMIFGEFMELSCTNGICNISRKIPGHYDSRLWNSLFHSLINIPSCSDLPDLNLIQKALQEVMMNFKLEDFVSALSTMKCLLEDERKK